MKTLLKLTALILFIIGFGNSAIAQENGVCDLGNGIWTFTTDVAFELTATGRMKQNGVETGSWKCDPETGQAKLSWNTGDVKYFTFSQDGNILYTKNDWGEYEIAANKTGKAKEVPGGLMDQQKGASGSSDPFDLGKAGSKPKEKDKDKKKGNGMGTKGNN
jgi:hypothetical protein